MDNQKLITELFYSRFQKKILKMEKLPLSGSSRLYYRIACDSQDYIATLHDDVLENERFIYYSQYFKKQNIAVPEIYCISEDRRLYIQEDLGRQTLLDVVSGKGENTGQGLSEHSKGLYKKSLSELLRMQTSGSGLDYSGAIPRPSFDRRCMMWDLNYFKYCFVKLTGVIIDENLLENDFEHLTSVILSQPADTFMFRDFQSRNIMIREDSPIFIDYQGGRKGPLAYDVVSLVYDADVAIPANQKEELILYYTDQLERIKPDCITGFIDTFYPVAAIRLLQALGAFGLRGLHEKKRHFIDAIKPCLKTLCHLFDTEDSLNGYTEINKIIKGIYQRLS